jgi:hypothetical protein
MEEKGYCELCDQESELTFIVVIDAEIDEDTCIRDSAEICAGCLFRYPNNYVLMFELAKKEKAELDDVV